MAKVSGRKALLFSFLLIVLYCAILSTAYLLFTFYRSNQLYDYLKSNQRGWRGHVHKADSELGYAPIPNSRGAHVMPLGPEIPMRYGADGFRVPVSGNNEIQGSDRGILTLGCSYTYGDAVLAEKTFPYLTAQQLGLSLHNAGVCGYGLTQMFLEAKKWIPVYKPKFVIVQFSPWIIERASQPFAPAYYMKLPVPYISKTENGFEIKPPVFLTAAFELPFERYQIAPKNFRNRLSFFKNVGILFFVYDDLHLSWYSLQKALGFYSSAELNGHDLAKFVYGEIFKLTSENGGGMVLIVLGADSQLVSYDPRLFSQGTILVDAHQKLLDLLPEQGELEFSKAYHHWRGNPPTVVDKHPNEAAHAIIADEIVKALRTAEKPAV